MSEEAAPAKGAARRRRDQRDRQTAGRIKWLVGLRQASEAHHTAAGGPDLRSVVLELRSDMAQIISDHAQLQKDYAALSVQFVALQQTVQNGILVKSGGPDEEVLVADVATGAGASPQPVSSPAPEQVGTPGAAGDQGEHGSGGGCHRLDARPEAPTDLQVFATLAAARLSDLEDHDPVPVRSPPLNMADDFGDHKARLARGICGEGHRLSARTLHSRDSCDACSWKIEAKVKVMACGYCCSCYCSWCCPLLPRPP